MHHNNRPYHLNKLLKETLEYKDLEGMLKPTIHIDEFSSKMGDDEDIIVISFFVRDRQAAKDLVQWFEKGYDFILDADQSPGEIKPNRYLVYVEIRRRNAVTQQITQLLQDLETLTEFDINDWSMVYKDQSYRFDQDNFKKLVPLSPREYREKENLELNEVRLAAGLTPKAIYEIDSDLRSLQSAAGI
jgi:hypothetical protein